VLFAFVVPPGISAGMFWMYRRDFDAIGGFDEDKVIAEDVDLALRLRAWGKSRGLRYGTLWRAPMVTSCRKFDRFGDWFPVRMLLKNRRQLFDAIHGKDRTLADWLFYDFKR
jgi:GT2 family glycosyltransferase